MLKKRLAILLIILGVAGIIVVSYINSKYSKITRTFSSYSLLSSSWEKYKKQFINQDGRVVDISQNAVTTSEAQSYAMLRAVWMNDRGTFDLAWKWTKDNLKKGNSSLFAWRWGKRSDGSYGVMVDGGDNTASDADSDIALSLIMASKRWSNPVYLGQAKAVLADIWKSETVVVLGKRYLTAGNWAENTNLIVVNPSYFSPYAWRIFAQVDGKNDWNSLVNPAYELLSKSGQQDLAGQKGVGLPPDWVGIDKKTGELKSVDFINKNFTVNYSYDALRVPWRVELDYLWNKDPRAKDYLQNSFNILIESLKTTGKLYEVYSHDGNPLSDKESPAMYAGAMGFLMAKDNTLATEVYQQKIIKLYSNDENNFSEKLPYYEQNWLWFGAALYNNRLSNF